MGNVKLTFNGSECDNSRHTCICRECGKETFHHIIFKYDEHGEQDYGRGSSVTWKNSNQIIQCLGCENVSFRTVYTDSESIVDYYDYDDNPCSYPLETIDYYPPQSVKLSSIDADMLPPKVSGIYKETLFSIENQQYVLAGIGIRAIVETVCKDLEAAGGNLGEKINSLKKMSIVTSEGADTLHKLRVLGNKAAHDVQAHNSQQLELAMEIIDHMLSGTYIIPQKVKSVLINAKADID